MTDLALDTWWRYQYLRDHGHLEYVKKAKKCDDFFKGLQWEKTDLDVLQAQKRPALTINKILSTIANVTGEQINNRTETTFRPRRAGANQQTAEALSKVYAQIADNNQLKWKRTDAFLDGLIGSRGFFDVRLDFSDSLQGDIRINVLNPKNVLIDSDATSYDPDEWNDVIVTKWLSLQEVEVIYGKKWRNRLETQSSLLCPYDYDTSDWDRDQFGTAPNEGHGASFHMDENTKPLVRMVRVVERQWKKLSRREFFVNIPSGEIREIHAEWDENDIAEFLANNPDYTVIERLAPRIRWTVVAGTEVLHDDWSPYKRFTIVPFFPYFRRGTTIGVCENLLGPQELLNKVSSQELHVVNTSANSGWKVKSGSLVNMSAAELEERGAQSGLVLELDDIAGAEKITPNQIPTGLERISYKAEEHIKTVSGVPDAATGFAREDVSARALKANQMKASSNFALVEDNLSRTDHFLARVVLDLIQCYYTEERLVYITTDPYGQAAQEFTVNQPTPEGEIINDLTLGEYDIVVTSQPERDSLEDSTFEQAAELRKELGVAIPDSVLIQCSRIPDKTKVMEAINAEANSEEAQADKQLDQAMKQAEVEKLRADAYRDKTDAELKQIKAMQESAASEDLIPPETQLRVRADLEMKKYEVDAKGALERERMAHEQRMKMLDLRIAQSNKAEQKPAPKAKESK